MKDRYTLIERALHRLALGQTTLKQISHDLERALFLKQAPAQPASHGAVLVCGLARSGTTVLLQGLDATGQFASLIYRDMPFILAPNLWRMLNRHQPRHAAQERAHGDGLMVHVDSPESFEEVFWQLEQTYRLDPQGLHIPLPDDQKLRHYADYQALVCWSRRQQKQHVPRYLAKNNNHLMRLPALMKQPNLRALVVFRNPLRVAASLHQQHQRFLERHRQSPFDQAYMSWLGHHEFGAQHAPFAGCQPHGLDPDHLDYWLQYWINVHQHVLRHLPKHTALIHHEAVCLDPIRQLTRIGQFIQVTGLADRSAALYRAEEKPLNYTYAPALLEASQQIYAQLQHHPAHLTRSA
jgi:hypothetical protein